MGVLATYISGWFVSERFNFRIQMQVLARCSCKFSEGARARVGCHILKFLCSKWQRNCETGFKAPDEDKLLSHFPSPRFNLSWFRFVLKRVLVHASKDR